MTVAKILSQMSACCFVGLIPSWQLQAASKHCQTCVHMHRHALSGTYNRARRFEATDRSAGPTYYGFGLKTQILILFTVFDACRM